jgi:hypothetical protein
MVLGLTLPPWHVQAASRDDLGSRQNLLVEDPYECAQLTRSLPGQRVKYGFEVTAEVEAVTPALKDAAIRTGPRPGRCGGRPNGCGNHCSRPLLSGPIPVAGNMDNLFRMVIIFLPL